MLAIKEICSEFDIGGKYLAEKELHVGNINRTFYVKFERDGEEKEYIIQHINKNVFKDPEKVMDNIVRVTEHVREKLRQAGISTRTGVLRAFLSKKSGKPFVIDADGEYWRCYRFIKNSTTYDSVDDLGVLESAGHAFGEFLNNLCDFDAKSLYTTIPNFHNTKERYKALHDAVEKNPVHRVELVEKELALAFEYEQLACKLQEHLDSGEIPYRVAHNDTKCNNVSFDKDTGNSLAVLDLDTVMPGAVAHDFGDAIRFIANTVIEDDPNFDKVSLDLEKYQAFAKGFIPQVKDSITDLEKQTMNLGVFAMTVELAVRFLTDYLLGDVYFKIKYLEHNLVRTKNQLALASDIKLKMGKMQEILEKYI